jgi:hypothetical protein
LKSTISDITLYPDGVAAYLSIQYLGKKNLSTILCENF